jgi:hypothetical protein
MKPLTDEEIKEVSEVVWGPELDVPATTAEIAFARAIEAAVNAKWEAENKRLREALENAADDLEHWGAYASDYFKKKWNLQGDIDAARAALKGDV